MESACVVHAEPRAYENSTKRTENKDEQQHRKSEKGNEMASSPKSMFSGVIQLGEFVNINVTIGKAWSDEREQSLTTVNLNGDVAERVLRNEHLASGKKITNKQHAVEVEEGVFRVFKPEEFDSIEHSTKTPILRICDVVPLRELPLIFTTGCYYCRHDTKAKVSAKPFKALCVSLASNNEALICKWGNSSKQKLVFISIDRGVMILRTTPFATEIRVPSKMERAHWAQEVSEREVAKMMELLSEIHTTGTPWTEQFDEGLRLRQEAVDRILNDEDIEIPEAPEVEEIDYFAAIDKAIAAVKGA